MHIDNGGGCAFLLLFTLFYHDILYTITVNRSASGAKNL